MSNRKKKPAKQPAKPQESIASAISTTADLPEGLKASAVEQPELENIVAAEGAMDEVSADVTELDVVVEEAAASNEDTDDGDKAEDDEKSDDVSDGEDDKSDDSDEDEDESEDEDDNESGDSDEDEAESEDDDNNESGDSDEDEAESEDEDEDDNESGDSDEDEAESEDEDDNESGDSDEDEDESEDEDDNESDDETSAPEAPAYDFDAAEEKLMALQHQLQENKIPLVIVLEGWQAAGKGTIAGELLEGLDPRGYKVCVPERFSADEDRYPPMHRYWVQMPKQGMITLFVGSWYHQLCAAMVKGKHPKRCERQLEQISLMEQMLVRDGAVIEKFFLDIPAKVQKKRLKDLDSKKVTRGTLSKADWEQNRQYDRWQQIYQQVIGETEQPGAHWHTLNGEDKKACKQALYETIMASMEQAIAQRQTGERPWDTPELTDHDPIPTEPIPELELYETDITLDHEYKVAVKEAQKKLHKLQYQLYRKGIPMVIAFEGWDAAGKGGSIRRLTSALDPRGFTVIPVAAPTAEEKAHHHMWRFWKELPLNGDIRIFDRTWYGRAMVERLEGFCTEAQWKRSYEEMNLFEKDLHEAGTILCKFWLQISPEEQLKRFNKRAVTPEKQWKITDEDWRNREKWDEYEVAVNEMLKKTNTAYAPWTVVEADNKHYARVKVLNTVIEAIEKRLNEE